MDNPVLHIARNSFEGPNRSTTYTSDALLHCLQQNLTNNMVVEYNAGLLDAEHNYYDRFAAANAALLNFYKNADVKTGDVIFFHELTFLHSLPQVKAYWRLKNIHPFIIGVWRSSVMVSGDAIRSRQLSAFSELETKIAACVDVNLYSASNVKNPIQWSTDKNDGLNIHALSGLDWDTIDSKDFDSRKSVKKEPNTVLFPHRWDYAKNVEYFIELTEYFTKNDEQINFKFILRDGLPVDRVERLERAGIELVKPNNKAEYYDLLASTQLVVSFSELETYGWAMVEAARFGCKILAPSVSPYNEIFASNSLYPKNWIVQNRLSMVAKKVKQKLDLNPDQDHLDSYPFLPEPLGIFFKETVTYYIKYLLNQTVIGN